MVPRHTVVETAAGRAGSPVQRLVVFRSEVMTSTVVTAAMRPRVAVDTKDVSQALAKPGDVRGLVLRVTRGLDDDGGIRIPNRPDE